MSGLKAVLIEWSPIDEPPDWMAGELAREGVSYTMARCRTKEELARNTGRADIVVSAGDCQVLTEENLPALSACWAIVQLGSGVDNIEVEAATRRGILVCNTPGAFTDSVSDHAIALLLAVVRQIRERDTLVRQGVWDPTRVRPPRHLRGATLGIVGFGRIGQMVAAKLAGFGMNILVYHAHASRKVAEAAGVELVGLEELLTRSDFVTLHCPLTEETKHLLSEREFRMMQPGAILVNTSRGAVVDEEALVRALTEGWIGGAGLDVLEKEPPDPTHPLFELDNVLLSPHLGFLSDHHPEGIWRIVQQTVVALANHRWPPSVVNQKVEPRWKLV